MPDEIPLTSPPVVAPDPAPAPDRAAKPAPGVPAPKNKGGRRSTAEEVDAYLAKNGLVATPAASASLAAPAGINAPPVEAPRPFDEASTRAGITGVVETISGVGAWQVGVLAEEITGSDKDGEKFAAAAAMPEPTKKLIVDSGVEWCRMEGVNFHPGIGVGSGLGQYFWQLKSLVSDLKKFASEKRQAEQAAPPKPANAPPA